MSTAPRGLPLGGALMALCAVGLVAAVIALVIEGRPDTAVTSTTTFEDQPIATVVPEPSLEPSPEPIGGEVTADEATAVLNTYVDAYNAEDPQALTALMTADVVRASDDEQPVEGAEAVAAVYAEQFDALDTPRYSFSVSSFKASDEDALVSGTYTISSATAGSSSGGIAFHLVRVDGELLIDRLDIVSSG
jgi:ketosteroid isomerase-like protein